MPGYCSHCGTELHQQANFCWHCGTAVSGARPSVQPKGEYELYRTRVKSAIVGMTSVGESECIVTNEKIVFRASTGPTAQLRLRDLESVESEVSKRDPLTMLFNLSLSQKESYYVRLNVRNDPEYTKSGSTHFDSMDASEKFASAIKDALLTSR